LAAEEMAAHLEAAQARSREAHDRLTETTTAHAAELEQIRADAQARIAEARASAAEAVRRAQARAEALVRAAEADPDQARVPDEQYRQAAQNAGQRAARYVPAGQGTLVSRDGSVSRDVPTDQDASAVPDPEREVTVVPGVPRYHDARCFLIRFMGNDDLDKMTVAAARQADCTPCRACEPDKPRGPDQPSQGDHGTPGFVSSGTRPYAGSIGTAMGTMGSGPAGPGSQHAGQGQGVSLAEAVQAAHEEGQEFGGSVARDAPALWLEAVLFRKPRMPSDMEARLLNSSALPVDFLLHDEVQHALRRGFWDALERTRGAPLAPGGRHLRPEVGG
jgi:hypothetical protein